MCVWGEGGGRFVHIVTYLIFLRVNNWYMYVTPVKKCIFLHVGIFFYMCTIFIKRVSDILVCIFLTHISDKLVCIFLTRVFIVWLSRIYWYAFSHM